MRKSALWFAVALACSPAFGAERRFEEVGLVLSLPDSPGWNDISESEQAEGRRFVLLLAKSESQKRIRVVIPSGRVQRSSDPAYEYRCLDEFVRGLTEAAEQEGLEVQSRSAVTVDGRVGWELHMDRRGFRRGPTSVYRVVIANGLNYVFSAHSLDPPVTRDEELMSFLDSVRIEPLAQQGPLSAPAGVRGPPGDDQGATADPWDSLTPIFRWVFLGMVVLIIIAAFRHYTRQA